MRSIQLATCVAAVCLAACAPTAPAPPPAPIRVVDTVTVVDTVVIETESSANAALEESLARVQIQLLESDVQIAGLQAQLDETRRELVRNMAKLQSQASRAEAASGMAEAEIALESLRGAPGGPDLQEFSQAESLVGQSTTAFNAENYGGALYLAVQARTFARSGQARLRTGAGQTMRAGETVFALPVPLQTVGRSNLRSGPGLDFGVDFTLEGGVSLIGQSFTNQWLRVTDEEGREGWVFHTLVTSRQR